MIFRRRNSARDGESDVFASSNDVSLDTRHEVLTLLHNWIILPSTHHWGVLQSMPPVLEAVITRLCRKSSKGRKATCTQLPCIMSLPMQTHAYSSLPYMCLHIQHYTIHFRLLSYTLASVTFVHLGKTFKRPKTKRVYWELSASPVPLFPFFRGLQNLTVSLVPFPFFLYTGKKTQG